MVGPVLAIHVMTTTPCVSGDGEQCPGPPVDNHGSVRHDSLGQQHAIPYVAPADHVDPQCPHFGGLWGVNTKSSRQVPVHITVPARRCITAP